jgi:hypothetical protein
MGNGDWHEIDKLVELLKRVLQDPAVADNMDEDLRKAIEDAVKGY